MCSSNFFSICHSVSITAATTKRYQLPFDEGTESWLQARKRHLSDIFCIPYTTAANRPSAARVKRILNRKGVLSIAPARKLVCNPFCKFVGLSTYVTASRLCLLFQGPEDSEHLPHQGRQYKAGRLWYRSRVERASGDGNDGTTFCLRPSPVWCYPVWPGDKKGGMQNGTTTCRGDWYNHSISQGHGPASMVFDEWSADSEASHTRTRTQNHVKSNPPPYQLGHLAWAGRLVAGRQSIH